MRKSIASRYFYSTATLLICSIAIMGFIQMYLSMGYFGDEKNKSLVNTIDNAYLLVQEARESSTLADAARVGRLARELTITARASESLVILTDDKGMPLLADKLIMDEAQKH
ncbi:MAG: hypothetical protein RSC96_01160, partial [Oscillospiraceae bacterium]